MTEQPVPPVVVPRHAPKMAAVDVLHAVVAGQLLVQERVVRLEKLRNRPVAAHLALEEELRLAHHGRAQRVVERREQTAVGLVRPDVAHLQPLADEVVHEAAGAPVDQHPPHLGGQHVRIAQPSARPQVDQLVVRQAPPKEERQPRRQLQIAQRMDLAGLRVHRPGLDSEQELRHREQRFQPALDARLEVALRAALAVRLEQRLDLRPGDRPAVRAARQRSENLARARLLGGRRRVVRTTGEDLLPAGRRRRHGAVERTGDVQHPDGRQVGDGGRARGGVGERDGHESRARRERQAERHPAVGRHPVLVQPLPRDVVLARRDQRAGSGPGYSPPTS